jgi:dynactin-6
VFGIRSRVLPSVSVGSHCVVGAGCLVQADPFSAMSVADTSSTLTSESTGDVNVASDSGDVPIRSAPEPESAASQPQVTPSTAPPPSDSLDDYTHVFGAENRQRKATSEGDGQAKALFAKHWEYLRDTLPRYHKLKMF